MPANYVLLGEVTVESAGAASVTFSNIPQTGYTDLKIAYSARSTAAAARIDIRWYFNSDTSGSNYSYKRIFGYESGVLSGSGSGTYTDAGTAITGSTATTSTFSNNELYIPNYTGSTAKSASGDWTAENNSGSSYILGLNSHLWNQTAAISSITFSPASGNFAANSTFSLYGLAAVGTTPVIAPLANGGDIVTNDGTYWIHTFLSSGTFTPKKSLNCDYLVVAGGGGGGNSNTDGVGGGGGGAGGLRSTVTATGGGGSLESPLSLLAQGYAVTIGAGGADFTNGSSTTFATITSTGGGAGAYNGQAGSNGGSGGGAGSGGDTRSGGTGTSNQGYAGGANNGAGSQTAGGGGGAGAVGGAGGSSNVRTGGNGVATSISGSSVTYAGGGGGAGNNPNGFGSSAAGGTGGGGASSAYGTGVLSGVAGTANRGGGGGGALFQSGLGLPNPALGGAGGSGIVIVRYPMAS